MENINVMNSESSEVNNKVELSSQESKLIENFNEDLNKDIGFVEGYIKYQRSCPLCNLLITRYSKAEFNYHLDIEKFINETSEEVNDICFNCFYKLSNWIKVHREFCIKKNLSYYDIANMILRKKGSNIQIGFKQLYNKELSKEII